MNCAKVVMLSLLALRSMAQTPPQPADLFFEPLPEGESEMPQRGDEIIPQIANSGTPQDGGYFMIFQVSNRSMARATFHVEFFDSNGQSMNMPVATSPDDLTGTPARGFRGALAVGGYGSLATVPNGSPAAVGYAVATMDPAESVAINATFVNLVPGRPPFMAGVPLSSGRHKTASMLSLSGDGFTPSLALVSRQPQDVTLIARAGLDGAELCRATMNFGAGHHRAFLLRDVLPCTAEGTLEIRGDPELPGALAGIGFAAHEEGAFVTQPIWANLQQDTSEMLAPADEAAFNDLVVGKRVATSFSTAYVDFVSPGRFSENLFGVIRTGSYSSYRNTGLNTGTLTFDYDGGNRCTVNITFDSTTSGMAASTCDNGSSIEYNWRLVEIPPEG